MNKEIGGRQKNVWAQGARAPLSLASYIAFVLIALTNSLKGMGPTVPANTQASMHPKRRKVIIWKLNAISKSIPCETFSNAELWVFAWRTTDS